MVRGYRAHGFGGPIGPLLVPVVVGAYGPTIAAVVTTGLGAGWKSVWVLLGRYLNFRAPPFWYLVAILTPCLTGFAAILLAKTRGVEVGAFSLKAAALVPMAFVAGLPFGPLAEELGWRGFALPRLARQGTLIRAALIVGVAWTFWHLPLYWAPAGTGISGEHPGLADVAFYLVEVTCLSFLFAWVARHSADNLVLAILLHLSVIANLPGLFFAGLEPVPGIGFSPLARQVAEIGVIPLGVLVLAIVVIEGRVWWRRGEGAE